MADSAALLRMLEPAVRPVDGGTGSGPPQSTPAIERQSFEQLLDAAQQQTGDSPAAGSAESASAGEAAEQANPSDPLGPLNHVGAIENAALRTLMDHDATVRDLGTNE